MRDLAAILRGELKRLEAELAQDPRWRKAEKIRELLAMYQDSRHASVHALAAAMPRRPGAVPALVKKNPQFKRILLALQIFRRAKSTAVVARARLVEMARTNHWPNASSTWLQLQTDPTLSHETALPTQPSVQTATLVPGPSP